MKFVDRIVVFALLLLASGAGQAFWQDAASVSARGRTEPITEVAFAALYLIIFVMLAGRLRKSAVLLMREEKWTMLLVFWALASILWSAGPGETLRRALGLVGTSAAGLYIGMKYEPRQQLKWIAVIVGLGAIASLAAGLFFPGSGIAPDGAWQGVYFPKNSLGRIMALGAISFALLAAGQRRGRLLRAVMFLLCCVLLVLSRSATAIVVSILVIAFLPLRRILYLRVRQQLLAAAVVLPLLAGAVVWVANSSGQILLALGRDSNLTGRIPLWQSVWDEILRRPVLGFGFTAFWDSWEGERVRESANWDVAVPHAHNGFLELWLGLGIVGLALLMISLVRNFRSALRVARTHRRIEYSWPLFLLVFTVLYNLTETSLLAVNSILWMAYVASSYWLTRAIREESYADEMQPEAEPGYSVQDFGGVKPFVVPGP